MSGRFTHSIKLITVTLALLMLSMTITYAQEDVIVPDVVGLSIPEAAAQLNANGLRLGRLTPAPLTRDNPTTPNTISTQSIAANTNTAYGTAIALTFFSNARITLIYDDNDITMRNESGATLNLNQITLASANGTQQFAARRWRGSLDNGDCTQLWSIARRAPKDVAGCASTFWFTSNNTAEHFWTQTNGVSEFSVTQNNTVLNTCPAAPANSQNAPLTCEFYVNLGAERPEFTEYVYFSYTTEAFAVINNASNLWMPLGATPIYNFNPQISVAGASLILGDPELFQNPDIVANVRRLAPRQCLLFTLAEATNPTLPENCDVIAQRALNQSVAFWLAPFELNSPFSSEGRATCPAATEGRLTRCIMPR